MSRDPEVIQAEIEQARQRLAGAVDQIVTRYNPRAVAERSSRSVASGLRSPAVIATASVAGALVAYLVLRRIRRR